MSLQKSIEQRLFKWIFKEKLTSNENIQSILEYLEEQKEHAKELELPNVIEWIDKVYLLIQSRNFEKLPIDLKQRSKDEILHYLYMHGLKQQEINIVMGVIEGRIKPKVRIKEEVEFYRK